MSFTLVRDNNNTIIKKNINLSSVPTINNSISIGSTGNTNIASVTTLNFNGTIINSSGTQLNYTNVTPGIAQEEKALVLDSSKDISGINTISTNNLIVNGTNINASLYSNTSSDDLNNTYLTGITNGIASASKALITNSSLNISNLNNISSKSITLNSIPVSTGSLKKKINLNVFNNKRLIPTSTISNICTSSGWNQINIGNTPADNMFWQGICYSPDLGIFVGVSSGSYQNNYSGTGNRVITSSDGINWIGRTAAYDTSWQSICWSSKLGLFIAVSSGGSASNCIMSSPNGIDWTTRTAPVSNGWNSVCWSPELSIFVSVGNTSGGYGNKAMYSYNGIDWNLSKTENSSWNSICWSPELNLFVAVASVGTYRIMVSSDGINWIHIKEPTNTTSSWQAVVWAPELGLFLASATSGSFSKYFMRSSDGFNWISSVDTGGSTGQVLAWSKDLEIFMTIESNGQNGSYSYDGIVWNKFQINGYNWPPKPGCLMWSSEFKMFLGLSNMNGLIHDAGARIWYTNPISIGSKGGVLCNSSNIFVNQANNYVGFNTLNPEKPLEINSISGNCLKHIYPNDSTKYYSLDVTNNGQFNITTVKNFNIYSDSSSYGLVLNNILIKTSALEFNNYLTGITNGTALGSKVATLDSSSNISGINLLNCNTLIVNGNNISNSTNNQYFQNVNNGVAKESKALIMDSSNNIGEINNISTSKLLINNNYVNTSFTTQNINTNQIINKIKYSKGDINKALSTWTLRSTANITYQSCCWSPKLGIFVGVASDGTNRIATSTNGIIWVDVVSSVAASSYWLSIAWSPELSLFVAVGNGTYYIITSSDGVNWMPRNVPENNQWRSVCWSSELSLFVAVSNNGSNRSMLSYDGINWYRNSTTTNQSWNCIIWCDTLNLFVASSSDSATNNIITSPDGVTWTVRSLPFSSGINSLAWSSELNIIVGVTGGYNNYYFYSKNGINWYGNNIQSGYWNNVKWISDIGIFIVLTNNTLGLTYSYDGLTWITVSISGNTNTYTSIVWSSELNMLVASSYSGTASYKMFTSDIFTPNNKSCIMSNSTDLIVDNTNGNVGLGTTPSFQLQLSTDSASKPSTSTWTVSSDERLKENIVNADLDICYNNIKNLRLAKYRWKDEVYTTEQVADRSKLGWIAQEVETIFPKSVTKINAHGFEDCRTLNTDQIIASLYGFSQKMISNYENDNTLFDSIKHKITEIESFLNNSIEE